MREGGGGRGLLVEPDCPFYGIAVVGGIAVDAEEAEEVSYMCEVVVAIRATDVVETPEEAAVCGGDDG